MFESIKSKISNIEDCNDLAIIKTFDEFKTMFESHNIDWNKFVEMIKKIDIDNPSYYKENKFGHFVITLNDNTRIHSNGYNMNIIIPHKTMFDSFNYIHSLMNDNIEEKYYPTKWLINNDKFKRLIETKVGRGNNGYGESASYIEMNKNNELIKFIDENVEKIIDKLNYNKETCKNRFVILNNNALVNGKLETKVALKKNHRPILTIVFEFNNKTYSYDNVRYREY